MPNPNELSFKKGALINAETQEIRSFQFNPSTLSESPGVNYSVTLPIQSEQALYQHINGGEHTISFQLFMNGLEDPSGNMQSLGPKQGILAKLGMNVNSKLERSVDRIATRGLEAATSLGAKLLPFSEASGLVGPLFDKFIGSKLGPDIPVLPNRNVLNDMTFLKDFLRGKGNKPPPRVRFFWSQFSPHLWIMTKLELKTTMFDQDLNPLHATADITLTRVLEAGVADQEPNRTVFTDRVGVKYF